MLRRLHYCIVGISYVGLATAGQPASPSPSVDVELICPTDNPVECYPRLFQPTVDFQAVREGQDLPAGLHVRLNIWTGEKEARFNIPTEDDARLEGLLTEQSIVVVDQPEDSGTEGKPALRDRVDNKPPVYQAAGKITPPRDSSSDGGDSTLFSKAVEILISDSPADASLDSALADLSELAHDIYYAVELTKSAPTVQHLMTLLSSSPKETHRHIASSILSTAMQNNPTAVESALKSWQSLSQPQSLLTTLLASLKSEQNPQATKSKIRFLLGLTKDPKQRGDFLSQDGMSLLLSIFRTKGREWTPVRVKIAQFVGDTFLDESIGATLGLWPKAGETALGEVCKTMAGAVESVGEGNTDACWEFWVEEMAGANEWGEEFLKLMNGRRGEMSVKGRSVGEEVMGKEDEKEENEVPSKEL